MGRGQTVKTLRRLLGSVKVVPKLMPIVEEGRTLYLIDKRQALRGEDEDSSKQT
jgi:hypothetical protein